MDVVVRVWLPDRPGALGQVASRIGAVKGDVVGIDILEQGVGRVIDELVVRLPSEALVDLLVAEIREVDGVSVEDVRPVVGGARDPRLDALEAAAILVRAATRADLLTAFVASLQLDFDGDWVAVVHTAAVEGSEPAAVVGDAPAGSWLQHFVAGSGASPPVRGGDAGPDDLAVGWLDGTDLAVVISRSGRPFHTRERRQLGVLAEIAGYRWLQLAGT